MTHALRTPWLDRTCACGTLNAQHDDADYDAHGECVRVVTLLNEAREFVLAVATEDDVPGEYQISARLLLARLGGGAS